MITTMKNVKTDVVLNMRGMPFITLTESKLDNTWYHENLDYLFLLTERGFKVHRGSKKLMLERGLINI